MSVEKTIAAVCTPFGTSGIAMVRLSGADAFDIAAKIFKPYGKKDIQSQKGYTGILGRIYDKSEILDEAIAFCYRSPKSYTGEDVIELSCHGGIWIIQRVLRLCMESGAIPAQPGEFTKRAFLNGKMDLLQAEAVIGLIHAQGDSALKAAMTNKEGALSTKIKNLVDTLTEQSAHLSAWADYPDEEIGEVDENELRSRIKKCVDQIGVLLSTYDRGIVLREGVSTAIVGKPNAGKSTVMNLLAGAERSIVTEMPGTTRDVVQETVRVGDIVLHLHDTAGIRTATDIVEKIGVEKAKKIIGSAQLVIAVFDSSEELDDQDVELLGLLMGKNVIAIINKVDLPVKIDDEVIKSSIDRVVQMSAFTGQGREQLEEEIIKAVRMDDFDASAPLVMNERQRQALVDAKDSLEGSLNSLDNGITYDAVSVEIDDALNFMLSLTGERATERVVDEIFSRFCVGK